jgi:hypothetical protein
MSYKDVKVTSANNIHRSDDNENIFKANKF